MSYKPKNPLELLIIRAFMQYFDSSGVLPLGNSIFAVAYEIYVRDFYDTFDYDVTCLSVENGHMYVDYYNNHAECYDGDTAPLWTPEECLYYTLMSVGLTREGGKYENFIGVDRKYRKPWKYYWKIDWEVYLYAQ
ncbi:MAG: hypothetical protein JTJ30_12720 [Catenibacterium mitsuokai]|nr:hypothetical protein [Catenibacterium mitsuokai]MBN2932829.1 hypothetical protein [Catenibacterium mitsuokai]